MYLTFITPIFIKSCNVLQIGIKIIPIEQSSPVHPYWATEKSQGQIIWSRSCQGQPFFSQINNCTHCTYSKNENDILNNSLFIISNTEECRTEYCKVCLWLSTAQTCVCVCHIQYVLCGAVVMLITYNEYIIMLEYIMQRQVFLQLLVQGHSESSTTE